MRIEQPTRASDAEHATRALPLDREAGVVAGRRVTPPRGTSIVVAGERFDIGVPVVLWSDPGGYDGYRETPFSAEERDAAGDDGAPAKKRYRPGRAPWTDASARANEPPPDEPAPTLERVRELVDQFVLHYDVAGTSRRCFEILHDKRNLSVHFLLDLDGTLYQTLDLQETAWHARQANPRSIGVEIANLGAYPPGDRTLDRAYVVDANGPRVALDERATLATADFVARPIRPERVRGLANGHELEMHDLTSEQYATLVRLVAALPTIFPKLSLDAPRDTAGRVRDDALSDEEFAEWRGLIGHLHVTRDKQDPGPAFDWDELLRRAKRLRTLGAVPGACVRE
ncbi:MAG: N-acetylmuramoyl-L-alanine amidase [Planctomycetes bacterium]|nr:N-acetylmuramoyl-L-alanine amidase [Planctomycetota bacterium]